MGDFSSIREIVDFITLWEMYKIGLENLARKHPTYTHTYTHKWGHINEHRSQLRQPPMIKMGTI